MIFVHLLAILWFERDFSTSFIQKFILPVNKLIDLNLFGFGQLALVNKEYMLSVSTAKWHCYASQCTEDRFVFKFWVLVYMLYFESFLIEIFTEFIMLAVVHSIDRSIHIYKDFVLSFQVNIQWFLTRIALSAVRLVAFECFWFASSLSRVSI